MKKERLEHLYKTKKTKEYNTIKMGIYYDLGGYNYFTGIRHPRCFYIGARAVNMADLGDGKHTTEFLLFDDSEIARMCQNVVIDEVKRFNSKKLEKLFNSVDWNEYGEAIENKDYEKIDSIIHNLRKI